ncbi:hypothetical protein [Lewinella sp. LCG006]|uniref:hypothetical protein n=1 Tax=Lewinella sp. LCG006 TaxID=3231911 RepID=UPI00345F64E6
MKKNLLYPIFCLLLLCCWTSGQAQDGSSLPNREDADATKKVQFNGLGRTILNNTSIDGAILDTDTTTARRLSDGEFLLDVAINAQPNDNTEVQGILRLRNEFGGFFGAGVTVEVRELWARGLIANTVRYRVGDFDHVMTPYTLFLADEEGTVNEPEVFRPQKEVIEYEQFYTDNNSRRLQGAKLDFGLAFPVILRDMKAEGFVARIRPTDFFTTPNRFVGGGQLDFSTRSLQDSVGLQADFGVNLSSVWDDLKTGNATSGITNQVFSVDFAVHVFENEQINVQVLGEAGSSKLDLREEEKTTFSEDDTFLEAGVALDLKASKLRLSATYLDVGPDFFSIAAQSKRVAFNRNKTFYNRIGNERRLRMPTLFDLGRDRALYNYQLSEDLMAYDPRYANVMPYGKATANRNGLQFGAVYGDDSSLFDAELGVALLKEIRGQGTFELKDFRQIRLAANVHLNRILDWDKTTKITLGFQQEQTDRGGVEVEQVDLSSTLIEVGLEAELFNRFDLLLGAKMLSAEGRDYVPAIEAFNDIEDFPAAFVADDQETMLGGGIRYRFKEDVYLTVQYQQFSLERALNPTNDYDLRQIFAQYVMKF